MNTPLRHSQQLTGLICKNAWTDTTVLDLVADFVNANAQEGAALLAYLTSRSTTETDDEQADEEADEDEDEEPEPAEPGQSVDDLDERYGIQRAATDDLFIYDEVKLQPLHHVWTILEGDDGSLWACAGFHIVNKLGYITTERPWSTGVEAFRFDD